VHHHARGPDPADALPGEQARSCEPSLQALHHGRTGLYAG